MHRLLIDTERSTCNPRRPFYFNPNMDNLMPSKVWDKIINLSQTSRVQPLKFIPHCIMDVIHISKRGPWSQMWNTKWLLYFVICPLMGPILTAEIRSTSLRIRAGVSNYIYVQQLGTITQLWLLLLLHMETMLLTHWGRDKMDAIVQKTFSNGFFLMTIYEFR